MNPRAYPNPRSLNQAMSAAAKEQARNNPSLDAHTLMRLAYFDRFLSRIFAAEDNRWVLKGGTALLARIPEARSTTDIDLLARPTQISPHEAADQLIQLAKTDLGDYFRFTHRKTEISTAGQRATSGLKITFDVSLGGISKDQISIDLVSGIDPTGAIQIMDPATRLHQLQLHSSPYFLYPIEDHLADKVCAIMGTYGDRPSSREKDLVDLVVAAVLDPQPIEAHQLHQAIDTERRRRDMDPITALRVPDGWGSGYRKGISQTPLGTQFPTIADATALIDTFLSPILEGSGSGFWDRKSASWTQHWTGDAPC